MRSTFLFFCIFDSEIPEVGIELSVSSLNEYLKFVEVDIVTKIKQEFFNNY